MRMRKTVLLAGILMGFALTAEAATYSMVVPKFAQDPEERETQNRWQDIGSAHLDNGITLPAYAISVSNPMEAGLLQDNQSCTPKSCDLDIKLTPAQSKELVALRISGIGWVLAPKQWRDTEAAVGVNGSQSLLLQSPNGRETISYYNSGACVGCAYSAASPFFPRALKLAQENDFMYSNPNPQVKIEHSEASKALFSYTLPQQYPTHGVAWFEDSASTDTNYQNLRVTLSPEHQALAGVILKAGVH